MPVVVFLSHAAIWTGCIPLVRPIFMAGGLAVDVFIFISGFLMLWHYLDREKSEPWDQPESWRRFWLRRFFRMTPLYWTALTVVLFFHGHFAAWTDEFHRLYPLPWWDRLPEISRIESGTSLANILSHYTYLFGFIPKYASNNPLPDWSIGLEMQFYLAFPFLALAIRRFGWIASMVTLVAVWLVALNRIHIGLLSPGGPWGWFPMPTFLPLKIGVFLCGMLAAGACRHPDDGRRFLLFFAASTWIAFWNSKWLVAPVAAFYVWEWFSRASDPSNLRMRLVSFGNAILKSRPIKFIADCSYGIYLWHIPLQLCMMRLLLDGGWFDNKQPLDRMALLTATALPLAFIVTWITFHLVEKPGIALGKRLLRKVTKPVSATD